MDVQNKLREELDSMTTLVAHKDAEIVTLKVIFVKQREEGTSLGGKLNDENYVL